MKMDCRILRRTAFYAKMEQDLLMKSIRTVYKFIRTNLRLER